MRGEVEALGLVSVCIELYLSLTYETKTEKAVGRATLTVEVEVAFFSVSVSISCEKKFAGSAGDPSFADVMGLPAPGAVQSVGRLRAGVRGGLSGERVRHPHCAAERRRRERRLSARDGFRHAAAATNGAGPLPLAGGDFPAFADWPATLAQMVFGIEFDGATTFDAHPDPASGVPDSATWHLLFDGCSVRDGEFNDLSDRTVRSFPVAATSGFVLDLYAQVAEASPTAFPPITTGPLAQLGDLLGSLGEHKHRYYGVLDNAIEKSELGGKTGRHLDRPPNDLRLAFAEAYRFYDRPGERDPAGEDNTPPRPESPDLDFHGFVAFCGDYPELLRVLGLAVDVVVP